MPKKLYVYVCNTDDQNCPIYAVAIDLDEIPDDQEGHDVGCYELTRTQTLRIQRSLR